MNWYNKSKSTVVQPSMDAKKLRKADVRSQSVPQKGNEVFAMPEVNVTSSWEEDAESGK